MIQQRVADWVTAVGLNKDKQERAFRFVEEALELAQACGVTLEELNLLIHYTYGRPVGEVHQEVSGVGITLMALGTAHGLDVLGEIHTELDRVSDPVIMAKIHAKALAAPEGPLPQ